MRVPQFRNTAQFVQTWIISCFLIDFCFKGYALRRRKRSVTTSLHLTTTNQNKFYNYIHERAKRRKLRAKRREEMREQASSSRSNTRENGDAKSNVAHKMTTRQRDGTATKRVQIQQYDYRQQSSQRTQSKGLKGNNGVKLRYSLRSRGDVVDANTNGNGNYKREQDEEEQRTDEEMNGKEDHDSDSDQSQHGGEEEDEHHSDIESDRSGFVESQEEDNDHQSSSGEEDEQEEQEDEEEGREEGEEEGEQHGGMISILLVKCN